MLSKQDWVVAAKASPSGSQYADEELGSYWEENFSENYEMQETGDLSAGLQSGYASAAGLIDWGQAAFFDAIGAVERHAANIVEAEANDLEAAKFSEGRISKVEDIDGVGDAIDWFQFNMAAVVPNLAETGVTATIGSLIGGGLNPLGFVAGIAYKGAIKDLVKNYAQEGMKATVAKELAKSQIENYTKNFAKEEFKDSATDLLVGQAIKANMKSVSAAMGAAASGYAGMGVGDLYSTSVEAGDPSPFLALSGGVPYAALDYVGGKVITDKLFRGGRVAGDDTLKGRLKNTGGTIAVGAPSEAATELGQEELNIQLQSYLDPTYDSTGEEAMSRRLNAAAAGGLIGGGLSTSQIFTKPPEVRDAIVADEMLTQDARTSLDSGNVKSLEQIQKELVIKRDLNIVLKNNETLEQRLEEIKKAEEKELDEQAERETRSAQTKLDTEEKLSAILTADGGVSDEAVAEFLVETRTQRPDDILNSNDEPFKTIRGALNNAKISHPEKKLAAIELSPGVVVLRRASKTGQAQIPYRPEDSDPIMVTSGESVAITPEQVRNEVQRRRDLGLIKDSNPKEPNYTPKPLDNLYPQPRTDVPEELLKANEIIFDEIENDKENSKLVDESKPTPTQQEMEKAKSESARLQAEADLKEVNETLGTSKVTNNSTPLTPINSAMADAFKGTGMPEARRDLQFNKNGELFTEEEATLVLDSKLNKQPGFNYTVETHSLETVDGTKDGYVIKETPIGGDNNGVTPTQSAGQAEAREINTQPTNTGDAIVPTEEQIALVQTTPEEDTKKARSEKIVINKNMGQIDGKNRYSKGNDVEGQTIEQAELVLREDKILAKLIDSGKLKVNSTDQVTEQGQGQLFSEGETVQGLYRDGVATVFADNNNADTTRATAYHEVFHGAVDTLSPKVRKDLLDRLGKLSVDKKAQWVVDAMAAIPESTSEANRAEELGAYAVTQYTLENNNLPASVIKWAKDVISKIKASVYKNTGVLLGSLDPVMLKAIAKGWKGEGVSQDGSVKLSVASTVSGLSESLFSPETKADMKIKGKKARAFIKKITTKFFTKEGLAGKVAFQLKIIADGMKNASGSDMDFNTAIFGQLAAKEYGVKGFYDIDESTINDMQKYMTGTDAEKADSSLPVNIKEGLNDLRAYVDNRTEAVMEGLDKLWAVKISQLSEENQELVSEWRRSQDDPESFDGMEVDLPNIPGIKGLIDLKEILESNMGSYLNRSFQAFDDKKWAEKAKENTKLIEDASTFIRENDYRVNVEKALGSNFKAGGPVDRETKVLQGIKYIQDETFIPTGLSEKQIAGIDRRRGDLLSETNEDNEVLGAVYAILESARDRSKQGMAGLVANGTKYGTKDVSMFNKRKVIDGSILALLGEHRDPILNVARSVTKMDYFIANNEYLINLREQGLESGLFRERKSVSAKDGMEYTVQYASKTSDTLDPLNGLWTSPDVIEGLEDFNDSGGDGGWVDSFIRFNSKVKYGKTVLSSGTAFRNLFGGSFFPVLMGHNPFTGNFKEALKESWADLYSKDKKFKDHIGKLTRLGVLHNSANASELKAILEDAMDMNEVGIINTNERALKYVPIGKIKRGAELAQNFYRMGDDLWKIVAFDKEVKDWMNVGYSEALAEKKAAYRIINGMPTYSMLPLGFRKLRRFPLVAPFVAFPYEVIRTVYNNYRFIQQDLKGVDENGKALDLNTEQLAKVKKLANKRLIGMAIVHAAAPGLALLSRVMNGVDDEEDKTRRLLGPEWGRNSSLIYVGTDSNGNRVTLDSTYIMPYSIFTRAYNAIVNGTKEDLDDKIRDSLDELFSPFYNVDITAGAALEIVTNKKRAGGVVYNDQGSSYDIAGEVSNYALNKLAPGLFLNAERIYKGFDGQKNSTGQPYSKAGEVAAAFGFRFNTMDVSTAIRYHGYEIKDRLSNAQRILAKKASDRNEVSDLDLKQAFEDSMVARNAAYNEVIRIVTGVEKMGYSSAEVRQSLMGARFSQKDISSLMNYTIPRYKLTKQFLSSVVSTIDSSSASNSQKREDKKMFTDRKRYIQMLERDQDR